MKEVIIIIVSMQIGALIGVFTMCFLQINKGNSKYFNHRSNRGKEWEVRRKEFRVPIYTDPSLRFGMTNFTI